MAPRIKRLSPEVASRIAAGEVVERPASVVKELVENSIDAGAGSVTVTLAEGGRRLIRVVDDGGGIARGDAPEVFERNATSKISGEEDLERISTLGFRGEALYSIASVARVRLRSRATGEAAGVAITVDGELRPEILDDGCPEGTTVEVRDIFYNTPARQKFLKSAESEYRRVADVIRAMALVNPGLRFRLVREGAKGRGLEAPPGTLRDRISDLFDPAVAENLVVVDSPRVKGYVGRPTLSYSTARNLHAFVNGRAVTDRTVNRAILDGFGSLLEGRRYPFAVIDIRIPPEEVDVNIHPAKSEVRFASQNIIYEAVKTAVRTALARGGSGAATGMERTETGRGRPGAAAGSRGYGDYRPVAAGSWARAEEGGFTGGRTGYGEASTEEGGDASGGLASRASAEGRLDLHGISDEAVVTPEFLEASTIGQLWGEFLLAQGGGRYDGTFYVVDQHAAAERCAFERLKERYYSRTEPARQMLLLPERIEASREEAEAINESMGYLERVGFEVSPFGPSAKGETFMVRSVPEIISSGRVGGLVVDVAVELAGDGGSRRVEDRVESVLMTIACHSVVRGPRPMTREEGDALLRELATVDFAGNCPHGRPVARRMTRAEVEGFFNR